MLDQVDVFIFDCDGVIWKGDTVRLSIALLARAAERVCVCCNCVCCVCVCL
jgi:ribonucleotide monophosphatase NagD (HAD superfamily)